MDIESLAKFATPMGLLALLLWFGVRILVRIGEGFITSIREMQEAFNDHSKADIGAINELTKSMTEMRQVMVVQLARIEGKQDGIIDERERTPVNQPFPTRRPTAGDDEDTPQIRGIRPNTPARGLPYSHIKKDR